MQKYRVSITEEAENDIAELMAFYEELVDVESAIRFFDDAMATIENLKNLPQSNAVFVDGTDARKVQMSNHKVAIVYIVDDDHYEVIAVRVYHQMQDPIQYKRSLLGRIDKIFGKHN